MELSNELEEVKKEIKQQMVEKEQVKQEKGLEIVKNDQMPSKISNLTQETDFSRAIDSAKISTIQKASAEDDKFNEEFKNELKQAVKKSAQLENEKQELEKQNIKLQQSYLQTKNEKEVHTQSENKWENKQKAREYHYNGLKDIMQFVHINNPMCIPLMYIFALLVSPIYLMWVLVLNPLGTLIAGTKDSNRPKLVKNAIYTILCVALVVALGFGVYALMHYGFKWF